MEAETEQVFAADLGLGHISDYVSEMDIEYDGTTYIVDSEGQLIAHSDIDISENRDIMNERGFVSDIVDGQAGFFQEDEIAAQGLILEGLDWGIIVEADTD